MLIHNKFTIRLSGDIFGIMNIENVSFYSSYRRASTVSNTRLTDYEQTLIKGIWALKTISYEYNTVCFYKRLVDDDASAVIALFTTVINNNIPVVIINNSLPQPLVKQLIANSENYYSGLIIQMPSIEKFLGSSLVNVDMNATVNPIPEPTGEQLSDMLQADSITNSESSNHDLMDSYVEGEQISETDNTQELIRPDNIQGSHQDTIEEYEIEESAPFTIPDDIEQAIQESNGN